MVIVNHQAGQLCNRIFHFSHFIVHSRHYQYKLVYPYFNEYEEFFDCFDKKMREADITLRLSRFSFLNRKVLKRLSKIRSNNIWVKSGFIDLHEISSNDLSGEYFDMNDPSFVSMCQNKRLLVTGWLYQDRVHLMNNSEYLRELFRPGRTYQEAIEAAFLKYRETYDVIVGVHIRRGDYRQYEGGQWFYSDEVYMKKMQDVEAELIRERQAKSVLFLVVSNEKVLASAFDGLHVAFEEQHFITDLYSLASCDYILGAPSTFSEWASFWGKVPLYHIHEKEHVISLSDFSDRNVK